MPYPLPLISIRYCKSLGVGTVHPPPLRRKFFYFSSSRLIWRISLRTCGINKKLIILHPFSVSNKQADFYGLINVRNVLGTVSQVLKGLHCASITIALCSTSRLRNFAGPSNYNIRAYFLDSSRHGTLLYQ